jgi:hypothetical protein
MCDKLQELHNEGLLSIRMRNKKWCSDLAKVILEPKEPYGDEKYVIDLRRIPLIPMANGKWRCPPSEDKPIYFPASSGTTIPPGLSSPLVDEEACACLKRRKLFRLQGVKDCDVPNVIKQILNYHAEPKSANGSHLVAQLSYLYKMRKHVRLGDMQVIYFVCPTSKRFQQGITVYADISVRGELQQLFFGYDKAFFLDSRYFAELDPVESAKLAEWLSEEAKVALRPRLIAILSSRLHEDFEWLLENKIDQVLAILRQYWSSYSKEMTNTANHALAGREYMCNSGDRAALCKAYLPLPMLLEKTQAFGNAANCHFLTLPSGDPMDWKFLSSLGVGLDEGLDFYLWLLNQSGFTEHTDVEKSRQLYLAIQSRVFSPREEKNVM